MNTFRFAASAFVWLLLQVDALGQANLDWFAVAGTPGAIDSARAVAVDAAGNVLVASSVASSDVLVAKYSPAGALVWSRTYDSGLAAKDEPYGLAVASNGDVCVCGTVQANGYDFFVLRYDGAGNPIQTTVFGGPGGDIAVALALDAQGNLLIAGRTVGAAGHEMLVQAYSPQGALLWDRRVSGAGGAEASAGSIVVDPGSAIFVGGSVEAGLFSDAAIVKLDAGGNVLWFRTWSGPYDDVFLKLASDRQGGVVAGGISDSQDIFNMYGNALTARCNANGNFVWSDTFANAPAADFQTQSVLMDESGITWALILSDWLNDPYVTLARYSASGVRLGSPTISTSALPAGLSAGNAGQVFACTSVGPLNPEVTNTAVVSQFDTSGAMNWQKTFSPVPGSGIRVVQIESGPQARAAVVGLSTTSSSRFTWESFVMQVDLSPSPHAYCTGKVNSLGCSPRMLFTGKPQAQATAGFAPRVEQVLNQKAGVFLYSVAGPATAPFGGGTLCVGAPVRRTIGLNSGGSPVGTHDCSGVFTLDMNAFARGLLGGKPSPALGVPGTTVWLQSWGRDSGFAPPNNVSLSNALTYEILP